MEPRGGGRVQKPERAARFAISNQNNTDNRTIKDPAEWTTGDERLIGAQESYLGSLVRRVGEEEPEGDLARAEASMKFDELREKGGMDQAAGKPKRKSARRLRA